MRPNTMKTLRTKLSKTRINKKMAKKGFINRKVSSMCKGITIYTDPVSKSSYMIIFDRMMERINTKYGVVV